MHSEQIKYYNIRNIYKKDMNNNIYLAENDYILAMIIITNMASPYNLTRSMDSLIFNGVHEAF